MDVTFVASEWEGGTDIWVKLDQLALNSNPGWSQWVPIDPVNPSYPGSWDPYNWGAVNTRTLTFNTYLYNWAGVDRRMVAPDEYFHQLRRHHHKVRQTLH